MDVIVTPAAAVGAFRYGEDDMLDVDRLFNLIFTAYWDAVGNPALVVPMGFTTRGLPLSLQIAGPLRREPGAARRRRLPASHDLAHRATTPAQDGGGGIKRNP